MESSIFNSILFGELRPWQKDFEDDRLISDILKQTPALSSNKIQTLHSRIHGFLKGHNNLYNFPENNLQNKDVLSLENVLDIDLPHQYNNVSRYYTELIQAESLRYINNLAAGIDLCLAEVDIKYLVNTALKQLRFIAVNASKELIKRNCNFIPEYSPDAALSIEESIIRNSHFAVYLLKLYSIKLIFEVQILYGRYAKLIESFEDFYINTLKEPIPANNFIHYSSFYFVYKTHLFLSSGKDNLKTAISLLDENKNYFVSDGQYSIETVSALENYIFIKHFKVSVDNFDFANLANTANYYSTVKDKINAEVNRKLYGYERYEIITEHLDKVIFINEIAMSASQQSAPRKLHQWLMIQAEAYKGNLSNSFAVPSIDDIHSKKKSNALPVKDKTAINEMKSQAQEFLKHFSGHNVYQQKIMTDTDYNRMIEYTFYLVEHEKLPANIEQIPKIQLSAIHIRYTYYLMHQTFYGTNEIKPVWIDFLQNVFFQLANQDWQTIKTKFSVKPDNYNQDMKTML
ncbi:MAG: hypothetical protein ACOYLE_04215 [Bacteroidales bacterium]